MMDGRVRTLLILSKTCCERVSLCGISAGVFLMESEIASKPAHTRTLSTRFIVWFCVWSRLFPHLHFAEIVQWPERPGFSDC